jgi:hypothetical protein
MSIISNELISDIEIFLESESLAVFLKNTGYVNFSSFIKKIRKSLTKNGYIMLKRYKVGRDFSNIQCIINELFTEIKTIENVSLLETFKHLKFEKSLMFSVDNLNKNMLQVEAEIIKIQRGLSYNKREYQMLLRRKQRISSIMNS